MLDQNSMLNPLSEQNSTSNHLVVSIGQRIHIRIKTDKIRHSNTDRISTLKSFLIAFQH